MTRWQDSAACAGTPLDWWFPPSHGVTVAYLTRAKQTCATCPVLVDCELERQAIEEEYGGIVAPGIWAGRTEADRRKQRGWGIKRT